MQKYVAILLKSRKQEVISFGFDIHDPGDSTSMSQL